MRSHGSGTWKKSPEKVYEPPTNFTLSHAHQIVGIAYLMILGDFLRETVFPGEFFYGDLDFYFKSLFSERLAEDLP